MASRESRCPDSGIRGNKATEDKASKESRCLEPEIPGNKATEDKASKEPRCPEGEFRGIKQRKPRQVRNLDTWRCRNGRAVCSGGYSAHSGEG